MSDTSSSDTPPGNNKDLSHREFSLRKYEARLGLLKVIVGTALVGLAGGCPGGC
ncbi:MAG: hypothetical protein K2Z80_34730 [Xanthobacteraceae bacterium]|nr:hypothetical protein [Xanthobacteraceae bacterium]